MREAVRGYGAAVIDAARTSGELEIVAADLAGFSGVLEASDELGRALSDAAIPYTSRRAVVEELLSPRASPPCVRLVGFAVAAEVPGELRSTVAALSARAADAAAGEPPAPEPPASKSAARDRIGGYAAAVWSGLGGASQLEDVEDELFRFARIVESTPELRRVLTDSGTRPSIREEVVCGLLDGRARSETVRLVAYAARSGRARDLVGTLDWLSERAAHERGRRIAKVRAAVPLDETQRRRLADVLTRTVGIPVELQEVLDPDLVGGARVLVGDTVIDGTLRRRIDQLREILTNPEPAGPWPAAPRDQEQRTTTHG